MARLTRLDDNKNSRISDAWIENGNFFKISNIQIGYTLPRNFVKKLMIQNARVYFAVLTLPLFLHTPSMVILKLVRAT